MQIIPHNLGQLYTEHSKQQTAESKSLDLLFVIAEEDSYLKLSGMNRTSDFSSPVGT